MILILKELEMNASSAVAGGAKALAGRQMGDVVDEVAGALQKLGDAVAENQVVVKLVEQVRDVAAAEVKAHAVGASHDCIAPGLVERIDGAVDATAAEVSAHVAGEAHACVADSAAHAVGEAAGELHGCLDGLVLGLWDLITSAFT